jgi:serine/threonine-protein kinase
MKRTSIVDIVEKTVDFLERTGADKSAQQYLHYALSSFAAGCEEQLAHYLVRYDIAPKRPAAESAQLLIQGDGGEVACFILDSYANLIGRVDPQTRSYPNIDLTGFDTNAKVSRRHAKIYSMDGRNFWIEDLGSFNGTLLNSVKLVPRQPEPLHDGDQILFGNTAVTFGSPVAGKLAISQEDIAVITGMRRTPVKTQENEVVQLESPDPE